MPKGQWSRKRERQYGYIKDSLLERGENQGRAEEIAARTVNKVRAQHGEGKTAKPLEDRSAPKRGGRHSPVAAGERVS